MNFSTKKTFSLIGMSITALLLSSCSGTGNTVASNRTERTATSKMPTIVVPGCSSEIESNTVLAYCFFGSATLLKSEGYLQRAKTEFLEVIRLDNKRVEAYVFLGDIYFEENDLAMAKEMYLASIELDSSNPVPFQNLGVIFDNSGQTELAIANYLESVRLDPDNSQTHYNLGLAYSRNIDSLDLATAELLKAIELDPDLAKAYYDLGQIYEYLNKPDQAIKNYRQALNLGYVIAAEKL